MATPQTLHRSLAIWLGLLGLVGLATTAQSLPALSDSPIYFNGVDPAAYQNLSTFLNEHNAQSPLKAYIVVAKEILDSASNLYIDRLSASWQQQSPNLAEQDYLILALGLNSVLELKFAGRLDARYGVSGKNLLDRFWESDWLPYARAGDYAAGLKNLITRVQQFFRTEDTRKAEAAQRAAAAQKAQAYFSQNVLPWFLAGLIALVLVAILLALRQHHLAVRRRVAELLAKTQERLALAQSHLNDYYEKYKLLFEIDGEVIYKGRTFERYQSTSKLVNRLQLGVQLLGQQVAKAERLIQSEIFIRWSKLIQAQLALTDEKVVLTTDEIKAGKVKLFSSMNFSLETQVRQLMDSLENYFAEAQTALDEIWNAILESGPAVAKAKELNSQVEPQLSTLRDANVAPGQYESKRMASLARLNQAEQLLKTDPLSAREQALQAQGEFQTLHELIAAMLQTEADSRTLDQKLQALRTRIATLHKGAFLLQEEGGPDPLCDHAADGLKTLRQALTATDAEAAKRVLAELAELLGFIEKKLDQTVEAKEKIPGEAARLRQRTVELRQLAKAVAPALAELNEKFALDSFKTESDNIDEVTAALEQCEKQIALALGKADPSRQEYLGALELLTGVDQAQTQCDALLKAIPEQLKGLKALREQAPALHAQVLQKCEQLAQFAKENAAIVSQQTDAQLGASQNTLQQLTQCLGEPRPDWPVIVQQLRALSQALDLTTAQALEERAIYQKLTQLAQELQSKLAITKKFLDEHTEDRAEANSDYQKASEFLADIQDGLRQGKSNWTELIKKAIRATELCELALSLAKQDVELYAKAMSELREAEHEIAAGGRDFGQGIHADLQPAREKLNLALSELRAGHYEQALNLADEADRKTAEAATRASAEAQRLEDELRERRRNAEMARAAITIAGVLLSSGSRGRGIGGFGGGSSSGWGGWGSSSGRGGGWSSGSGRRTW